jgi:hypothetical protein
MSVHACAHQHPSIPVFIFQLLLQHIHTIPFLTATTFELFAKKFGCDHLEGSASVRLAQPGRILYGGDDIFSFGSKLPG